MSVTFRRTALFAVFAPIVCLACAQDATLAPSQARVAPMLSVQNTGLQLLAAPTGDPAAYMRALNAQLAAQGAPYAVQRAELLLVSSADPNRASTVYANDRALNTGYRFVPGDPRRATVGNIVRQASFLPLSFAPTGPGTFVSAKPSVDASFATWGGIICSSLGVVNNILPANVLPSALLTIPPFINNPLASDINTVGFLPASIFDQLFGPGASREILGVTFPFVFLSAPNVPTDVDSDGNADAAFAEIWYNAGFRWTNTGSGPGVDIETVTLHENGHALGLGHFGRIAINDANGKLKVSPRAVMNAIVLGTLRTPLGTDNSAYCANWGSWPD